MRAQLPLLNLLANRMRLQLPLFHLSANSTRAELSLLHLSANSTGAFQRGGREKANESEIDRETEGEREILTMMRDGKKARQKQ